MNKLTALLAALVALAMMTGPSIAAETMGGEKASVSVELWKQLSPNTFGTGYIADGVSYDEFRGPIDMHYGVAPAWEGRSDESLTMIDKEDKVLRKHLAPNTVGIAYFADGVSNEEFRGIIDVHYGIAPAWEGRPAEPRTMAEELNKHLAPNVTYRNDVF